MPEQLYLLGNLVIMVSYAAIMVAIVVPVSRAGQLRTNHLALATGLIFFSCAVGHGLHVFTAWRSLTNHAHMSSPWALAFWDLTTAGIGVYYWTLRRHYGVLLGKGAMYVSPGEKHRLDEADARERAARDTLAPGVAEHIFEPFYTTKPRGKGTGLGLSTVYGIVTEAGGSINVFSERGVGTTFRIYLPLATTTSYPAPVDATRRKPPDGDGRTVLVVEDETALARVVTRILTTGGWHVLAAANGPEALQQFDGTDCDLLLTDVIMPEMSGPRLAELIHERRPGLPVLYMSGYSNGLLGSTRVLDRDTPFLEKPFTADELLRKVHEAVKDHAVRPR